MKHLPLRLFAALTALAVVGVLTTPAVPADKPDEGWVKLFNGKDLKGWVQRGGKAKYRAEDGEIVGTTVPNTSNSFLCTEEGLWRLHPRAGVQGRSGSSTPACRFAASTSSRGQEVKSDGKTIKGGKAGRVYGYQVEIDPDVKRGRLWTGGIYDEGRRGWLKDLKDNEAARKAFKPGEWNKFRIECQRRLDQDLAQRRAGRRAEGFADAVGLHRPAGPRRRQARRAARSPLPQHPHQGAEVGPST